MAARAVVHGAGPSAGGQATRSPGRRAGAAGWAVGSRLAIALVAAALLAGCSSGSDNTGSSTPQMSDLAGKTWVSTSVEGRQLVQGTTVSLTFTDDSISANAGCNAMHGAAKIEGSELVVGALASTLMACDDAKMAQDRWLSEFLTSKPTIALSDGELQLNQGDTGLELHAKG